MSLGSILPRPFPEPRELPDPGWYDHVFVDWDAAPRDPFGGRPKVVLIWQINARRLSGRRHLMSRVCTRSVSKGAALRALLERWQGHLFTRDQEQWGVDLEHWIGRPGLLKVGHLVKPGWTCPRGVVEDLAPWAEDAPRKPLLAEAYTRRRDHRRPLIQEL